MPLQPQVTHIILVHGFAVVKTRSRIMASWKPLLCPGVATGGLRITPAEAGPLCSVGWVTTSLCRTLSGQMRLQTALQL